MKVDTHSIEKILLIDDDEINNFLNSMIIDEAELAHEVKTYTSAEKALQYLSALVKDPNSQDLPDLILLDVNMPEMDGWDFLEEYKKLNQKILKKTKLMMLSSSMHERDVNRAKTYNFVVDYLPKPLTPALVDKIKSRFKL
jgi:CheY-like chemotaxis protein